MTMLLMIFSVQLFAQRYLSEIFPTTTVTSNVTFGFNYSILPTDDDVIGFVTPPGAKMYIDSLRADIYEPVGDVIAERAAVIMVHTGSFLPIFYNGQATGAKTDSCIKVMCRQFAKRGYTAIAIDNRNGWNPQALGAPGQEIRTGTLLQAAGRGIQDANAAIRYFRNNALNGGNTYKIDESQIILGGTGTGGYIVFGCSSVDSYAEISIPKFVASVNNPSYGFTAGVTYFDSTLWGSTAGYGGLPFFNNSNNTPGISNSIFFAFNMGGAMGDSSWLDPGDVPMVCFHVPTDPFAPYADGPVIVPVTGDFVVNVSGSYTVIQKADLLQNNSSFQFNNWTDPFTVRANQVNNGYDGLFPFVLPAPPPPATGQASPWDWADSTTVYQICMGLLGFTQGHTDTVWYNTLATNPNMSSAKGHAYIDSVMGYLNPRIFAAMTVGIQQNEKSESNLLVYPNPASDNFVVALKNSNELISSIEMFDISGRLILNINGLKTRSYNVSRKNIEAGVYLVKIFKGNGTSDFRKITIH